MASFGATVARSVSMFRFDCEDSVYRRQFVTSTVAGVIGVSFAPRLTAQNPARVDLLALAERKALKLTNRSASPFTDGARRGARLSGAEGEGTALVPTTEFTAGTIEIDLRGKDVPQESFLGVAFHAKDNAAYDCVYFRPFNFRAADPASRAHAVQYHSLPDYGWSRLRTEHPGQYEQPVHPVPNPNDWFHARVVVLSGKASVFVNDATNPCLAVGLLGEHKTGLVGLWVGNNSGGDFANLKITPAM
jgi:hypothetical protein